MVSILNTRAKMNNPKIIYIYSMAFQNDSSHHAYYWDMKLKQRNKDFSLLFVYFNLSSYLCFEDMKLLNNEFSNTFFLPK